MSLSLETTFQELKSRNEKALVAFVTAGDPSLQDLPEILDMLVESGVDVVEIGIPFSDPIADGPTIQASSQRALDRGVNPEQILEMLHQVSIPIPIVLMGYYNSVLKMGLDEFGRKAKMAGVCGTILSDVIPEEADDWIVASKKHQLSNVFLVAPTSTEARLDKAVSVASGFVYAVSRTGVTGLNNKAESEAEALVAKVRARTQLPICVGFGISTPAAVAEVCRFADGAVVGSCLVDLLNEKWNGGVGKVEIGNFMKSLKQATLSSDL